MSTLEHRERRTAPPESERTGEDEPALHRLFESVYSDGDLSVAQELVAPEFRSHCAGTGETYHGVSGLKAHASRLRAAFPGLLVEIDNIRGPREGFEAQLTAEGRFERAFSGVEPFCVIGPTGAEPGGPWVRFTGVVSGALVDGQLHHCDFDWDIQALRDQR